MAFTDATALSAWEYPPPFSFYNIPVEARHAYELAISQERSGYYSIVRADRLVAFYCVGSEATVIGGDYGEDATDVGFGLDPALTGMGHWRELIPLVLDRIRGRLPIRVTIADWNARARCVWSKLGFIPVQRFLRARDGELFTVYRIRGDAKRGSGNLPPWLGRMS
jgi:[ribosomal protein S18]-alanine N-acetyltransferase